jgi:uncharacterized membrane protein
MFLFKADEPLEEPYTDSDDYETQDADQDDQLDDQIRDQDADSPAEPVEEPSEEVRPPARRERPRLRLDRASVLVYVLLGIVLAVAAWLRFDAQNWDDFSHLHPDERFMVQVVSGLGGPLRFTDKTVAAQDAHRALCDARYPASPDYTQGGVTIEPGHGGYFDADCSDLNPNNVGYGMYVYGEFPLFTVHAAGVARSQLSRDYHALLEAVDPAAAAEHTITTYWEGYTGVQLVGRTISALADVLTVLVLFLIGRRLYGRWAGLLAAALYGVAAFPIQQSHFWTVDAFTTFWCTLALYFAIRAMDDASAQQGPRPLLYLFLWAGATTWDAAVQHYPVLGLVTLGGIVLLVLVILAALRLILAMRGREMPGWVLAGAGVLASVIYLAGWTVLNGAAKHDFVIYDNLMSLGFVSVIFSMAVWVAAVAADIVREHDPDRNTSTAHVLALGAVVVVWTALVLGYVIGGLSPWATLLVAAGSVALLVFDMTELTDYAMFGIALGGAVASRINVAPLAGIIVVAAVLKVLPALDPQMNSAHRRRLLTYAMTGVITAAFLSFFVFRLLQPHAFEGPGIFGLKINPGWRDDANEAAYLTSGNWDAPPNHQWAGRIPYVFPWRNIVEWGFGIPLGLVAWGAWLWAAYSILRGRSLWTRHAIPFVWIAVIFGWLGGRWVMTMRYFLPLYPMLTLLGAWALIALVVGARRRASRVGAGLALPRAPQGVPLRRLAYGGAVALLIVTLVYTTGYGFAFHNIERQQLTRVAASRWFQEFIPGDFGIWVEGTDGTRQMVNLGLRQVAPPPSVSRLEDGQTAELSFSVMAESNLTQITFNRLSDPARDSDNESVRVRLFRDDPNLGRQMVYEDELVADLSPMATPYGSSYTLTPAEPVTLTPADASLPSNNYILQVTVLSGGPVESVRDVTDSEGSVFSDVSVGLQLTLDRTITFTDLNFDAQPILTGHGDDIPAPPTEWTPGGRDPVRFQVPIDGTIREIDIPHLGDPLKDADQEVVRLVLTAPDGTETSAVIQGDFNQGADPLGLPQTVIFDPPLNVQSHDADGNPLFATLTVEAQDPVYTSGPVIAWEGDWDDPVPWPTCPLPDAMVYRDDLPSGLSKYTCGAVDMYSGAYQGLKLWMVAEDNDEKYDAMTNALDQADYIVITSNRFYDSLTRIPMRWPMTIAYYNALFDGRLGFKLVKTFEHYPSIESIGIPDQILPTQHLPDFLNEHWEAEEAFHVYDHPVVFVYQKTDAYSADNTAAILNSVSRRSVNSVVGGYVADPNPVGVVPWGAKLATKSPTMLELTAEKWEIQRDGGTWSKLFDMADWINRSQVLAVIVWWLLIVIAGWLAWPLLYVALPALPDRAYPAAKITAWLIVAWVAWVGGTFNLLIWSRVGLWLIVIALGGLSLAVIWRRRTEFAHYIRANRRHLLAIEGLTLLLFLAFLGVRAGNPDLWHGSFGGEKPMDFAYFNGVLRSTVFPPLDPWYSGGYINYYYFGYVIVGAPVKLIGLNPSVAYNLIIPALYAMTGIGVFSIAYNWVRARYVTPGTIEGATGGPHPLASSPSDGEGESVGADDSDESVGAGLALPRAQYVAPVQDESGEIVGAEMPLPPPGGLTKETPREGKTPVGSPWMAGLLALLLAVVLGNLGTLYVVVTNVAAMPDPQTGLPRWSQPSLYVDARRAELEQQRTSIYQNYYDQGIRAFRKEHGTDPSDPADMAAITLTAQQRTDEYITNAAKHPPLYKLWNYELTNLGDELRAFSAGLRDVMNGKPLNMYTHRWYWQPTRIIGELPDNAGHGAIAEMPYFTFLYGDLHAHMLAFPITLLVILWLVAEIIGAGHALRSWWEAGLALAVGALAVGVLRPTNSWDWITYLLLGVAALTYVAWVGAVRTTWNQPPSPWAERLWDWLRPRNARLLVLVLLAMPLAMIARVGFYGLRKMKEQQQLTGGLNPGETLIHPTLTVSSLVIWMVMGVVLAIALYVAILIALRAHMTKRILTDWIGRVALFVALTFVAALPFTMYFATAYNSVQPWKQETTPLWAYLYVHGTFIFIVISFLVWQSARWLRAVRVRDLRGLIVPVSVIGGGLVVLVIGGIVFGVRNAAVAELVIPLAAWAGLLFFLPGQNALLRAVYALIVLALVISLGVELVVLDGDIGRQNTVFKFYLQVWFMLSIVGGVTLAWMLRDSWRWNAAVRGLWQAGLAVLFAIGLCYPILGTQARFLDRFAKAQTPLTLDGMEYMKYAVHGENGLYFKLVGDYDMIRWLQENVQGTPVIMEAHQYPSEYHWNGRISIYTGLPTILGWRFHQLQQHTLPDMDKLVQNRENNVAAFYELTGSEGISGAMGLIRNYDIEYIVVGALERAFYGDVQTDSFTGAQTVGHSEGLAKFDTMVDLGLLTVAYSAPRCLNLAVDDVTDCAPDQTYADKIYRLVPGATYGDEIAAGS